MTLLNVNHETVKSFDIKSMRNKLTASGHYEPFVKDLIEHIFSTTDVNAEDEDLAFAPCASSAAERLIPAKLRSEFGIFFTPEEISEKLKVIFNDQIAAGESFFDPSCGAGNLLVFIAETYPTEPNFYATIKKWGTQFGGCDLNENFVHAAKLRLIAVAAKRHKIKKLPIEKALELTAEFRSIFVADYLAEPLGGEFDCIIANPPFGHITSSQTQEWCSGKTQLAGLFQIEIIKRAKANQKIASVLPDVLRSGTRYSRWRKILETSLTEPSINIHGRFLKKVDVDVFIISGRKKNEEYSNIIPPQCWTPAPPPLEDSKLIEDLFIVRIGPVVPHRIKKDDPPHPYLDVHSAPAFGTTSNFQSIPFSGTLYTPPFVTVRRTSNPADKNRIVPTLVLGKQPIAVENHLIIISPKNKKVSACRKLIQKLKSPDVSEQINHTIRCRHLTKKSIASIELRTDDYD